ncbi:MAG TPA: GNAT family N-acetyltransferase [Dehalococcoidales bacterium]|nr:GNAT family N-acetyltransferase [Dehalococcoidales bacterium]
MQILRNTPEFKDYEVVVAEEVIDGYLDDQQGTGYYALIAEDDSQLAGYVMYGQTPVTIGTWDIYWIAVSGEVRGKGIGKALTKEAEADIKKMGGRLILIETSSQPLYENTRRFYLGQKYEQVARIPDFYAPGDDLLIMQKRLN